MTTHAVPVAAQITWKLRFPKLYDGYRDDTLVVTVFESPFCNEKGVWKWRRRPYGQDTPHGPFASAEDAKRAAEAGVERAAGGER